MTGITRQHSCDTCHQQLTITDPLKYRDFCLDDAYTTALRKGRFTEFNLKLAQNIKYTLLTAIFLSNLTPQTAMIGTSFGITARFLQFDWKIQQLVNILSFTGTLAYLTKDPEKVFQGYLGVIWGANIICRIQNETEPVQWFNALTNRIQSSPQVTPEMLSKIQREKIEIKNLFFKCIFTLTNKQKAFFALEETTKTLVAAGIGCAIVGFFSATKVQLLCAGALYGLAAKKVGDAFFAKKIIHLKDSLDFYATKIRQCKWVCTKEKRD